MIPKRSYVPAPLPGTGLPPHGLFVDRWGTLLERPAAGWCARFREAQFVPGAIDALFRAVRAGWLVYLVGNETQVAHGKLEEAHWQEFEGELVAHLGRQGVPVRRSYACLVHPEGKGAARKDSVFRLPNTGALYHAANEDGLSLEESWVIGDSSLELSAGSRAGCRTAAVRTGEALRDGQVVVEPDFLADDLVEALAEILALERLLRR
jgi:D-glycero-D-manno-heptose 1,7-bisphosphate phosphatase